MPRTLPPKSAINAAIYLALMRGIIGITLIYLLVNIAYLHALGFEAARHSSTPAADVLENVCGPWAGRTLACS